MSTMIWPQSTSLQTEVLNANRAKSLNLLLPGIALCLLVGFGWIFYLNEYVFSGRVLLWLGMTVIIGLISWLQNANFHLRAFILLSVLFVTSIDQIVVNGPISWSILILLAVPLIATTHLGIRLGGISLFVTAASAVFPPIIQQTTRFELDASPLLDYWLIAVVLFPLITAAGLLSFDRLIKQMELACNRELELADLLEQETKRFEERVIVRTKAIQTSTMISQRIAMILDEQVLVEQVIRQLQQETGYYYAQIYLYDEFSPSGSLYLVADGDHQGRSYLPKGDRRPVVSGLLGEAMQTKRSILVEDLPASSYAVADDPIPNSLSQVAVPIMVGNEILGILDIRQNVAKGLDQDDLFLLEAVAGQLAVGIRNSRLFARSQKQAMREVLVNSVRHQLQTAETVQEALQIATRAISAELDTTARISVGLAR